jgi:hypothetical protein
MRIQQTDLILKEARYARHYHELQERNRGLWQRVWRSLTGLFKRS